MQVFKTGKIQLENESMFRVLQVFSLKSGLKKINSKEIGLISEFLSSDENLEILCQAISNQMSLEQINFDGAFINDNFAYKILQACS